MRRGCCLLWLVVVTPLLVWAQADKAGTGTITGRVTRGDKPLAGVQVFANRPNSFGGWQSSGVSAKTDSDGRYQLAPLAPGNYLITPRALADVLPGQSSFSYGKPVLVQDGETVEYIDFSLIKGGVITGRVTDEDGKPVVGAEIQLLKKTERGASMTFTSTVSYLMNKTDDRGVYRLFGLPPDKYLVRVGNEENSMPLRNRNGGAYQPPTFYPDVTNEAEAKVVEVTAGSEHTDIDIKLAKAAPTYSVRGRIVDSATSAPIVGARVMLVKLAGPGFRLGAPGQERTNLQGEFQIPGFGPGTYTAALATEDGFNYYTAPQKFEVVNSDVAGLELKAVPGSTVSGRVVIEGTKAPALLNPRALVLSVTSEQGDGSSSQSARLTLDPYGNFRTVGLGPGKTRFLLGFSGSAMFSQPRPIIARIEKDGQTWPQEFPLNANEQAVNVRVVVAYAVGVVRGQVNVIGGQPADAGQVRLAINPRSPFGPRESRMITVDAKGRFLLEGLLPGDYQIVATALRSPTPGKRRKPPVPALVAVSGEKEAQVTLTLDLTEEENR